MLVDLSTVSLLAASEVGNQRYWAYGLFLALIAFFLILDLGVFHREAHEVTMNEATIWSVIWLAMGLGFAVVVYYAYDRHYFGLGLETPVFNPNPTGNHDLIINTTVGGAAAAQEYLTDTWLRNRWRWTTCS